MLPYRGKIEMKNGPRTYESKQVFFKLTNFTTPDAMFYLDMDTLQVHSYWQDFSKLPNTDHIKHMFMSYKSADGT